MTLSMYSTFHEPNWHWAGTAGLVAAADRIGPDFRSALRMAAPIGDPLNDPRPGRLMRSITYQRSVSGRRVRMEFAAHTPYAGYVIGGTGPHLIRPVAARALHWNTIGGGRFAQVVHHPGTAANRFPQRTMRAMRDAIIAEFARQVTS